MEGTCNECVFPLMEEGRRRTGTCPTDTSLTYAAAAGKLTCVKDLIAAGGDVNAVCNCHNMNNHYQYHYKGPLISAAWKGHSNCLSELIGSGAYVNMRNNEGSTALMYAAGHAACVSQLIGSGAEVNIQNNNGLTALILSAMSGHTVCLHELIGSGAHVNMQDDIGQTALM